MHCVVIRETVTLQCSLFVIPGTPSRTRTRVSRCVALIFVAFFQSRPFVSITAMRMNHVYSGYNNWSRLIVLGVVPFALLVFFNARIYSGISQRSGRQRQRQRRQERSSSSANAANAAGASAAARRTTTANASLASPLPSSSGNREAMS